MTWSLSSSADASTEYDCRPIETAKLIGEQWTGQLRFGGCVDISGNTAVIGANRDGSESGSVYVFTREADGTWLESAKLTASDGADYDQFGQAAAIEGDRIFVGAPKHGLYNHGAVYIYERDDTGAWSQTRKLEASDQSNWAEFGYSVDADGDRLAVGATYDDRDGADTGSTYVYDLDEDGNWTETAILRASSPQLYRRLGNAVAIDGSRLAVGARYHDGDEYDSGSVFIFEELESGGWSEIQMLTANDDDAYDYFGHSLDLQGNRLLVSTWADDETGHDAGAAYFFQAAADGTWSQAQKITAPDAVSTNYFGDEVRLDGDTIAISAPGYSGANGATYIFTIDSSEYWTYAQQLIFSDSSSNDFAGQGLGLDGDSIIIGIPADDELGNDAGGAVAFQFNPDSGWSESTYVLPSDGTGSSLGGFATSIFNNTIVSGAPAIFGGEGQATVFEWTGDNGWSQVAWLQDESGESSTFFGYSVALHQDTILVSARGHDINSGRVYTYERNTDGLWDLDQALTSSDASSYDRFGWSMDLDDQTAVIGAIFGDAGATSSGSAYVFDRDFEGSWVETAALSASDGEIDDQFGYCVSVTDDLIAVGSPYDDNEQHGTNAGAAYVFHRDGDGNWAETAKLLPADGYAEQQFGTSMASSAEFIAVGAPRDDGNRGAVYLFEFINGEDLVQSAKLVDLTAGGGEQLGGSITIDGNYIIAGARYADGSGSYDAGAVVVFLRDADGSWSLVHKIGQDDPDSYDNFGWSVDAHQGVIATGAPNDDGGGHSAGALYVFTSDDYLDCNQNGECDSIDFLDGVSLDCNGNDIPDECDIADGTAVDCNSNGIPDSCDLDGGLLSDCNDDGFPDECETDYQDCNGNGIADSCDLDGGTSDDCNTNGQPDECELTEDLDCNQNGILDSCDIKSGASDDLDGNGIPDECPIPCPESSRVLAHPFESNMQAWAMADSGSRFAVRSVTQFTPNTRDINIAIYEDGSWLPIAAFTLDPETTNAATPSWGEPIAMDDNWLAIATCGDGLRLYYELNGEWIGPGTINDAQASGFPGYSVAMNDGWLAVSNANDVNSLQLYDYLDGTWTLQQEFIDSFLIGSAIDLDGEWLFATAIGQTLDGKRGTVHVLRLQDGTWIPWQVLTADFQGADNMPMGAHVHVDGDLAVATSSPEFSSSPTQDGQVHIYRLSGDEWTLESALEAPEGSYPPGYGRNAKLQDGMLAVSGFVLTEDEQLEGVVHIYDLGDSQAPVLTRTLQSESVNSRYGHALLWQPEALLANRDEVIYTGGNVEVLRLDDAGTLIDCNANGICDSNDIFNQTSFDCDDNGVPDECDIADGLLIDIDDNLVPDACEPDCDGDQVPDGYEIAQGLEPDCNGNGVPDGCDIAGGYSPDGNQDGIPDECGASFVITVDPDGGGLFSDLQAALDFAPPGSIIQVAPGTYTGPFTLPSHQVSLIADEGPGQTRLTAAEQSPTILLIQGDHDRSTIVDGFSVEDETSMLSCVVILDCSPTLRNMVFRNNLGLLGASIRIENGSPLIENCLFEQNSAGRGGAMSITGTNQDAAATVTDCQFIANEATIPLLYDGSGGALAATETNVEIMNSQFLANTSAFTGGGVSTKDTDLVISGCEFLGNQADVLGAAAAFGGGEIGIQQSRFCGNDPNDLVGQWIDNGDNYFGFDCDDNGQCDIDDIAADPTLDCDSDGLIDACELASGDEPDCNNNGIPDWCDINVYGTSFDFNANGVPDECKIDCNDNGFPDYIDIQTGNSEDCDGNGIPDECEDCNSNGIGDGCDIADGTSNDVDQDGIPDECQDDCDQDGSPDAWEIDQGLELDCNANSIPDWCDINVFASSEDCDGNGVPDECDLASGALSDCNQDGLIDECQPDWVDCNTNGVLDSCDLDSGSSIDCNQNGTPDECDLADGSASDCNQNGVPDSCEIADGSDTDCNSNGILDSCDIKSGVLYDCDTNGIADICQSDYADCNENGLADLCDIEFDVSDDLNNDGIPDECDPDCNQNGYPDFFDIAFGISDDDNENGIPDECECPDIDDNGIVDVDDLLILIGAYGPCPGEPGCPADVNWDGMVDVNDLLQLLERWGEPCDP
ncbi:MAG: hypothetical protein MK116_10080 [Phycisphaerales bacterium]|nr:hypothetical protein [Phycisphaerales bacterium]